MTIKELKETLANMPDDAEVYMDLSNINAKRISGVELDEYQNAVFIY